MVRLAIRCAVSILLAATALVLPTTASHAGELGGGMSFSANPNIVMSRGQTLPPVNYVWVENSSKDPIDVKFNWNTGTSTGIALTVDDDEVTLKPGERHQFNFGITVDATATAGKTTVFAEAKQVNVKEGVFTPAIGGRFELTVEGEASTFKVNVVSTGDGTPVSGDLRVGYIGPDGKLFEVAATNGSELSGSVAPGKYRATFALDNLAQKSEDFVLASGEAKNVTITVDAISFLAAAALPKPDLANIVSADLVASVKNNIRELAGPVTLEVSVKRDGTTIDTVVLQRQPLLPVGITEGREAYIPSGGWTPGTYTFDFVLKTPDYTIEAANPAEIVVSAGSSRLLIAAAAVLAIAVIVVVVILRRRRRQSPGSAA